MSLNTTAWNRLRYTLYAPIYDLIARRLQSGRRRSVELLNPQPGQRVLIVGAGTGLDVELLPPAVDIVATDLAPAMVEKMRAQARRLGRPVEARVMDGQQLDFPDASFDAVILHLILAVIPDPVACIREAARVLKPSGRIAIFDKFAPDGQTPSLGRRLLNPVTSVIATEINRQLGPLLQAAHLRVLTEDRRVLGGLFQVAVVVKTNAVETK